MIAAWINTTQEEPPRFFDLHGAIDVAVFSPKHSEAFLLSRVNDQTKQVSVVNLSGHRSVMKDLYRKNKLESPPEFGDQTKIFSGLKRIEADAKQSGGARDSGKAPLTYSDYMALCTKTLQLHDGGFVHLFITTQ